MPEVEFARARGPRVAPRASRARDSDEAEFVKYVRALRRPKRAASAIAPCGANVVRDARDAALTLARARREARRRRATSRAARERASGAKEYSSRRDGDAGWTRRPRRRDARETRGRTRGGRRVWIVQRAAAERAMKTR